MLVDSWIIHQGKWMLSPKYPSSHEGKFSWKILYENQNSPRISKYKGQHWVLINPTKDLFKFATVKGRCQRKQFCMIFNINVVQRLD